MHRFLPGALMLLLLAGCQNTKTAVDANAVLGPPPPRTSLDQGTPSRDAEGSIQLVSNTSDAGGGLLTRLDSEVVARIGGQPVFAADVIRPFRPEIETRRQLIEKLPPTQQNAATEMMNQQLGQMLASSLDDYIDREVILRDINRSLKPEQVEGIREQIDMAFDDSVGKVISGTALTSQAELEGILLRPDHPQYKPVMMAWGKHLGTPPGTSLVEARESFTQMLMAVTYLQEKAQQESSIGRGQLLEYYRDHALEYDVPLEVKWDQIVIDFAQHDGKEGATKVMQQVLQKLRRGDSFADVAKAHSSGPTADAGGARDWIQKGTLADSDLEDQLFELPVGGISKVAERSGRFEIVQLAKRRGGFRKSFESVQDEIRGTLEAGGAKTARENALRRMRESTNIVVLFQQPKKEEPQEAFPMFR